MFPVILGVPQDSLYPRAEARAVLWASGAARQCALTWVSSCFQRDRAPSPWNQKGFFLPCAFPRPCVRADTLSLWDWAPSAKLLIIPLALFVDSCQILLHRWPPPTSRGWGAPCRRPWAAAGAAGATLLLGCLGKGPGCLPVLTALGAIQAQLGLLSSFWKLSCSLAATCRNGVGEAQPGCSSTGLLGGVFIREGAARGTAGL